MKILDGKKIRDKIVVKLRRQIKKFSVSYEKKPPILAIIQLGNLVESNTYIRQKKIFGQRVGARVNHIRLPKAVSEKKIITKIKELNADRKINGIIVQMPIPVKLNTQKILNSVDVNKDVDGAHAQNLQKLFLNKNNGYISATARGIISLLNYYRIPVAGKKVVVVGRSALVGKPIALSLLNKNATVTISHRYSRSLSEITRSADILIVAAGAPKLIKARHVKKGQVVIDVGISQPRGRSKIVGDVDFQTVSKIVKAITPVPGGVGPMTVASLFENLWDAYKSQNLIQ